MIWKAGNKGLPLQNEFVYRQMSPKDYNYVMLWDNLQKTPQIVLKYTFTIFDPSLQTFSKEGFENVLHGTLSDVIKKN